MRHHLFPLAAAAAIAGSASGADPFIDAVVRNFQDLGYQYVEIERGPTRLKAEGVRGTEELEIVYDLASGRILRQETGFADDDDIGRRGVVIETSGDFPDDDLDDDEDDDRRPGRDDDDDWDDDNDEDDDRDDDDDEDDDRDDDRDDDDDDDDDGDDDE